MTGSPRAAKLAQRIKVVMAQALTKVVRDDAMESVTVTDARVTNDLQNATVYYTVFGDDEQKAYVAELFETNRGRLRKELGSQLTTRLTPTLEFVPDEVPMNASHVEDLLRAARQKDAEVAELAEGAEYAGDADPYKEADEEA
ncbi:30S ribosome-binding factor RbfA [Pseudoglutamicibacter cumminsii]|uniref:30S ribosome-binding factor RbfA n=1 Tax=Pseudoglutamicibacter cumminsii TaxID=156979 RepID=UPI002ABCC52D|nr:30S ribosome-binding factor RbfA [Pseudoglutamicibacter cumminsii]MDZ3746018.1 30S ribosome-binding factor RbfA [Pseudoglutamicibacter cumminsii]